MKSGKTKAPTRYAIHRHDTPKQLIEMDSDEIMQTHGNSVAGGEIREKKKKIKMLVSGKSVFKIKEIITKKK